MRSKVTVTQHDQTGQILLQPVDGVVAVDDVGLAHQLLEQGDGGLDAADHQLVQRAAQAQQAFVAVLGMDDQLARQAVVIGRDAIAGIDRANRSARPGRRAHGTG